jgi:hypothetical protein
MNWKLGKTSSAAKSRATEVYAWRVSFRAPQPLDISQRLAYRAFLGLFLWSRPLEVAPDTVLRPEP